METQVSDGSVTIVNAYDRADRLKTRSIATLGRTLTFGYDRSGLRTSLQINAGTPQTYRWDENGRLVQIVAPGGATATFHPDTVGLVTRKELPNNVTLEDEHRRVIRMLYTHAVRGTLEDLRYTYDGSRNRS